MKEALQEAKKAYDKKDVPIGAVIVLDGKIIGKGHNQVIYQNDPTAHAEILAIKQATHKIGYERLYGATMYSTCEPCMMCIGASILARLDTIVIGAKDYKTGCCGSAEDFARENKFNHKIKVIDGVLQEECSNLISQFFKEIRIEKLRNKR